MNVKIEEMSARVSNRADEGRSYDIEGSVINGEQDVRVEGGTVRSLDGMEGVASFSEYDNGHLNTTFEKTEGRAAVLALIEEFVAAAKAAVQAAQ